MKKTMKTSIDARLSGLKMTQENRSRVLVMALEGEEGKRFRFSAALVIALAAALITGACAAAIRFGMADFRKEQQENEAFLENVVRLDATYENEWLTLTVNDAVFDGNKLALTMNLAGKPDAPGQAYVLPGFSLSCGGKTFPCGVAWSNISMEDGFLLPDGELQIGAEIELWDREAKAWMRDPANGPAEWTITLSVLEAQWPMSACAYGIGELPEETANELTAYDRQYQEAYRQKRLMLNEAGALTDYACQLPAPEGVTRDAWNEAGMEERLVRCGAMKRADTAHIRFAAPPQDAFVLKEPYTIDREGFSVTVNKLEVTFAAVEYELEIRAKEGNLCEDYLRGKGAYAFAVLADGAKTDDQASGVCITTGDHRVSVGGKTLSVGEAMLCDGSLLLDGTTHAITFVPCFAREAASCEEADAIMREQRILTEEQAKRAFTIAW